jgi:heme/copper-type cytochrome/quinol oxidase subunit 2
MEQDQNSSLFGLSIDPMSKAHLADAARWAKFLAIMGFIVCGLIVIVGIFAGSVLESFSSTRRYEGFDSNVEMTRGLGIVATVFYILIAVLYFFPCLFLFNFASKMKTALLSNDQDVLNSSFQNLKKTFRYIGVLSIIVLAFWVVGMLIALANTAGR